MPADWGAARTTLSFSRNRGIRWQPLVERLAESGWDWTVPDVPSSNALLRAEFQDDDGTLATVVLEPFAIGTPDLSSDPGAIRVERLALGCAPNPFAGGADITLALPARGPVELSAFSVTGQRVSTLVTGIQEAGIQRVRWEAHDARGGRLPAGIYFLRLETPGGTTTRRVVLLR
jgi:hypothetical protein